MFSLSPREGKALLVHLVDRAPLAVLGLQERMAVKAQLVRTMLCDLNENGLCRHGVRECDPSVDVPSRDTEE